MNANNNLENTMTLGQVLREYFVFVGLMQAKYPLLIIRNEDIVDVSESLVLLNAGGPYDRHVHLGSGYVYVPAPVGQEHLATEIYLIRPNAEYKNFHLQMVDMYTDASGESVLEVSVIGNTPVSLPSLGQRISQMSEDDLEVLVIGVLSEKFNLIVEFGLDAPIDDFWSTGIITGTAYTYASSYDDHSEMHHCLLTVDDDKLWCSVCPSNSFKAIMVERSIDGTEETTTLFTNTEPGEFDEESAYLYTRLGDFLIERSFDTSLTVQLI